MLCKTLLQYLAFHLLKIPSHNALLAWADPGFCEGEYRSSDWGCWGSCTPAPSSHTPPLGQADHAAGTAVGTFFKVPNHVRILFPCSQHHSSPPPPSSATCPLPSHSPPSPTCSCPQPKWGVGVSELHLTHSSQAQPRTAAAGSFLLLDLIPRPSPMFLSSLEASMGKGICLPPPLPLSPAESGNSGSGALPQQPSQFISHAAPLQLGPVGDSSSSGGGWASLPCTCSQAGSYPWGNWAERRSLPSDATVPSWSVAGASLEPLPTSSAGDSGNSGQRREWMRGEGKCC